MSLFNRGTDKSELAEQMFGARRHTTVADHENVVKEKIDVLLVAHRDGKLLKVLRELYEKMYAFRLTPPEADLLRDVESILHFARDQEYAQGIEEIKKKLHLFERKLAEKNYGRAIKRHLKKYGLADSYYEVLLRAVISDAGELQKLSKTRYTSKESVITEIENTCQMLRRRIEKENALKRPRG